MSEDPHQLVKPPDFNCYALVPVLSQRETQNIHERAFKKTPQSFKNQARVPNSLEAITGRMDQQPPPTANFNSSLYCRCYIKKNK